jgi:hypothetical protein
MRKITPISIAMLLGIGLFASKATLQADDASRISFHSISKTEDKGTSVLIIPMNGQMSTDISIDAYEPLFTKIKDLKPDLIILEMFCQDFDNEYYEKQRRGDKKESNGYDPDAMQDLVRLFRIKLKDISQVMWIQDSCGGSSVLTLAWPDIYMSDKAKLEGTRKLARNWNYIDRNKPTWGKMYQAWTAHVKNVAEIGGRSKALLMTFVDPELTVSGTYDGRNVVWKEGIDGYLLADHSRGPIKIYAGDAEQYAISKATVRNRDEILLAEGIREYHLVGEDLTKSIEQYKIDWRKTYEKTVDLWFDAQQYGEWATGEDTERYLRKQLKSVEQIIRLLKRWDAVGFRMMSDYRISKDGARGTYDLRIMIKELEERLRALRDSEDSGGRSGGGGLAGSSGGGGAR